MSRKLLSLTAVAVAAFAAGSILATQAGGKARGHAAWLKPVVIHETFTPLPCSGAPGQRTTLQMEGCAEKQILKSDTQVNQLAAEIFSILRDDRARRDFNAAQLAWLNYRKADCFSVSDLFEGGTEAGVLDAQCVASRNTQRVKDLRAFHQALRSTVSG
jgi:uncharacterized protein YecT (DUF1311 family)